MKNLEVQKYEILDNITDSMERAGYNNNDIMAIKAVAVYEGLNKNNALLERDDLEKAVPSFVGKPLFIVFKDGKPTGHGFNFKTKRFDNSIRKAIGVITLAYGIENEDTGIYEVIVEIAMWQKYYPVIASVLRQLHEEGKLKFSFEADREFTTTKEGYRKCFNINFRGLCVVENPAFSETRSLMVAELLSNNEGGNKMDEKQFNEMLNAIKESGLSKELASQITEIAGDLKTTTENLKVKNTELEKKMGILEEDKMTLEGELKKLKIDRDKYKNIVEKAEAEKLGKERLNKISKYKKEVEETAEELASMSQEDFLEVLEKAIDSYDLETASNKSVYGVSYEDVGIGSNDNKAKLLDFIQGLEKDM